ncbi:E3 ubiquitin-protein ligase rad18 [Yamadazyma tenuis]|nr:E3 ubiquitin-protein ligase rad18 [Yamadazyma tenuis]
MIKNTCPLCLSNQLESNLRRVVVLEEIVNCFKSLRPFLLDFLQPPSNDSVSSTSDRTEIRSVPKRKLPSPETSSLPDSDDVIIISEEDEPMKRTKLSADEAECPICNKKMEPEFLQNTHIDNCLNGHSDVLPKEKPGGGKKGISAFFKPRAKNNESNSAENALKINHSDFYFNSAEKHVVKEIRLAKLDFNSLSVPKLKEKLHAIGIPTTGSRHQLELRYNQYYILFNANLDSSHPVDVRVLRQRLSRWESSHVAFTNAGNGSIFGGRMSTRSITDKQFSVTEWQQAYHQDFKELTRRARANTQRNLNLKTRTTLESEDSNTHPKPSQGLEGYTPLDSNDVVKEDSEVETSGKKMAQAG